LFQVPGNYSKVIFLALMLLPAASLAAQKVAGPQQDAAPNAKVVAALVDLFELRSGETIRNEDGEIVRTAAAMDRGRTASARLARMGRPAWPLLLTHLDDKRASMPATEAPGPHTVGMIVHATIRSQIVSYPARYPDRNRHLLDKVFQPSLKHWLTAREKRSIEEIQIELLQHAIGFESAIRPQNEFTQRNLSDLRIRLANLRTMQAILHPPNAAPNRQAAGPDQQAKTIASLVDQLELRPEEDDTAAIDRIYTTDDKLRAMGRPAWSYLATHLKDKRPSIPTGAYVGPYPVGDYVYSILWREVVSGPTRGYPSHKGSAWFNLYWDFRPSLADWLKAREKVPLEDIHISMVEALIRLELEAKERGKQADEDVSNLRSHLKNLKLVKAVVARPDKPLPAAR
jgi:hypothetical protein